MHSISITVPSPGGTAWRHDRDGMGLGRNAMYASFMAAKSFMSAKYTLYLTTFSRLDPASSKTSLRFCNAVLFGGRERIPLSVLVCSLSCQVDAKVASEVTHRGLLDLSCCCLAGAENEAGHLDRRAWEGWSAIRAPSGDGGCIPVRLGHYSQLWGLGGNFSLEMSSRDIVADEFDGMVLVGDADSGNIDIQGSIRCRLRNADGDQTCALASPLVIRKKGSPAFYADILVLHVRWEELLPCTPPPPFAPTNTGSGMVPCLSNLDSRYEIPLSRSV